MDLRFLNALLTQLLGHTDKVLTQEDNKMACPSQEQGSLKTKDGKEGVPNSGIWKDEDYPSGFQMPLHYPRFKKADYEKMDEVKLDLLLREYGLSFKGTIDEKRAFAMGAFLWPAQL